MKETIENVEILARYAADVANRLPQKECQDMEMEIR